MNISPLSPRAGLSTIAGLALALVGAALWLQHAKDMAPCPLCVLQRYAFVGVALCCALGAMMRRPKTGASLGLACAVAGLAVAGRHLKALASPGVSCGVDPVETVLNRLPTATLAPWLFEAQGACGDALEKVWGLMVPQWSAAWLALIALALLGLLAKGGVKAPFSRRV